ncbi:MAG: hypothetical protein E7076_01990 [Bacteroidales bacterium]|nr:hypothetical protein [Bacteroidales bacterium]
MTKKKHILLLILLAIIAFFGGKYASNLYHKQQQRKELKTQIAGTWTDAADSNTLLTLNADGTIHSTVKNYNKWEVQKTENSCFLFLYTPQTTDTLEITLFNPTLLIVKHHERTTVFKK